MVNQRYILLSDTCYLASGSQLSSNYTIRTSYNKLFFFFFFLLVAKSCNVGQMLIIKTVTVNSAIFLACNLIFDLTQEDKT